MFQRFEGGGRWAVLILQVFLGVVFALHGAQKLFGAFGGSGVPGFITTIQRLGFTPSDFWAWVVIITEFFGGLSILVGLLTRFWAAALIIEMTVAIIKVNWARGFFWLQGGWEFPLTLGVIALTLVLTGPSFVSVDRALGVERRTA